MIDDSKKLLSVHEKRGDGSTRPPVVTGQPHEARRGHEAPPPVRGDRTARRRTRNDKVQRPVPAAVDNPEYDEDEQL